MTNATLYLTAGTFYLLGGFVLLIGGDGLGFWSLLLAFMYLWLFNREPEQKEVRREE